MKRTTTLLMNHGIDFKDLSEVSLSFSQRHSRPFLPDIFSCLNRAFIGNFESEPNKTHDHQGDYQGCLVQEVFSNLLDLYLRNLDGQCNTFHFLSPNRPNPLVTDGILIFRSEHR